MEEKRKDIPQQNNFSIYNSSQELRFSMTDTGAVLHVAGNLLNLTTDEFQMCKNGNVPTSIQEFAASHGITPDKVIQAAREAVLPEIYIKISEKDNVSGYIRNGPEGLVQFIRILPSEGEKAEMRKTDCARFVGYIGPIYRMDGATPGIGLHLNGIAYAPMTLDVFYTMMKQNLSIPGTQFQKFKVVINAWVNQAITRGQFVEYRSSPIYVDDGIVRIEYPCTGDLEDILRKLLDFHDKATHPLGYRTIQAWSLIAPLHDELKRHARKIIQVPQIFMAGKTQGGKTPLAVFFIGIGYAMPRDSYFYPYQTVRTTFTLMRHLGETNLPALFDDLPPDWLYTHKEDLKAYVQTGHFGDRGRSDQTITEYRGKRSFVGTVNQSIRIDDDLAASNRLIILRYTEKNRRAQNITAWNALLDGMPDGFMFEIFRALFEGMTIDDLAKEVENFRTPADWINYGLDKLNQLNQGYGLSALPPYAEEATVDDDSNALEICQAFLAEFERIERNKSDQYDAQTGTAVMYSKYRSPIEGEFVVERKGVRKFIYFTGAAFKTLTSRQQLKTPYRNATDFLNNIANREDGVRVENEGRSRSKRVGNTFPKMYCISVKEEAYMDE